MSNFEFEEMAGGFYYDDLGVSGPGFDNSTTSDRRELPESQPTLTGGPDQADAKTVSGISNLHAATLASAQPSSGGLEIRLPSPADADPSHEPSAQEDTSATKDRKR